MTTRPYELLARFGLDGNVSGVSVRTITNVNGRDYEGDPQPLSGASDPAFIAFANQFAAAIVAQRDQLLIDKAALETERDSLQAEVTRTSDRDSLHSQLATVTTERDSQADRIVDLESQLDVLSKQVAALTTERDEALGEVRQLEVARDRALADALLNPPANPRHLAPNDFKNLFTHDEAVAIKRSDDPNVILAMLDLQTITTHIDLDLEKTINAVNYFESAGLIAEGRAEQILAGEAPTQ